MKKILNCPETAVAEMCNGIVIAHPELELLRKYKVIKKKKLNKDKVTLISGGGSGHEPAHAGFVGKGMLDAAVCGDVFASPSQIQIYQALRETAGEKGTLMIIKNYSGDMMNFKNAAYLAQEDGIQVDYVKVDDDIAVQDSLYTVGRRGVAGTVFVHKIAGAAAERGLELQEVKRAAQKAAASVKSIGFALTSCTVPSKGTPTFRLGEDEMEYGVGIHGEPGIQREKLLTADELAARMVPALLKEAAVAKGDEAAVLVNGFGGTPLQELYLLNQSVSRELDRYGVRTVKYLVGNYMTSIDMAGASVSVMKLDGELKSLLADECDTPAMKMAGGLEYIPYQEPYDRCRDRSRMEQLGNQALEERPGEGKSLPEQAVSYKIETDRKYAKIKEEGITLGNMQYLVDCMSECIIRNEVPFCELDSHAGDGDFGMSVAKGFRRLKEEWQEITNESADTIGKFLDQCSLIIMEHCGGASGPIWGSAFRAAAKCAGDKTRLTAGDFAKMMQAAVTGIQKTGERSFGRGAGIGDKTLMDALIPCADVWSECADAQRADSHVRGVNAEAWNGSAEKGSAEKGSAKKGSAEKGSAEKDSTEKESTGEIGIRDIFVKAAKAAVEGAKSTEKIVARMGRAGTVGERSLGYPDAGAYGLGVVFTELANVIE